MDLGLTGRRALVVGASKGIGRGIAAELVTEGAVVAIASRSQARILTTAAEIGASGFEWDSDAPDTAPALLRQVEAEIGPIDILVCNTGGPPLHQDPLAPQPDEWQTAYRSLVLAPMALVRAVVPGMRERGWGRILNIVGTTVREPNPALILSSTHRAAAMAAWKTLSGAVASDGVTVNSILPGVIDTDRLRDSFGPTDQLAAAVPARRLGTVEEIAAASAFLCSERASYVTGVALLVDGGMTRSI